ncbi:MAG: MMPL family transporter [Methylococcales bacterium]|nr:MMPL family transporter [Methylococcaceae bacterium]
MSLKMKISTLLSMWGSWSLGRPFTLLALIILISTAALQYTGNNLSINTDTAELIAPDAPFQQNRRKFEKLFAQDMHTLLLVVESETPELTKAATKRLERLLRANKESFNTVYAPNDTEFFHQNGLLYLDSNDLQTVSNSLSQAQPFIGRISQEPDLNGFFSIFEDALGSTDKTQELPVDMPALIDKVSATLHKSINSNAGLMSWETLISEKKLTEKRPDKGFILASPKFDFSQIRPAEKAIGDIRKAVTDIQEPNLPEVKVWITGEVGLEDDELSGMSEGTFTASIFSIVLVCAILLIAYNSILLTTATFITLAFGMVFCGAFAAFSVKELNLISVAFAVSNMGLGVEYAIHFCLRYRDNLSHHVNKERAIKSTLSSTAPSLFLCAGTTAIGLYAFIPTDYKGVSELGLLAGTSLFICLLVTLVLLPVLLKVLPQTIKAPATNKTQPLLQKLSEKMANLTLHYAKPITIVTSLLAIVSIVLVFNVKTDFNPINLRDPNTESVIAFKNLLKDPDTSPMTLTVLAENEQQAKALQQKIETLSSVDKTISLFDFIPSSQEDKLAIIEEMSLLLGSQAQGFPPLRYDVDPTNAIKRVINTINKVLPGKTDSHEISALTNFRNELQGVLIELETRLQPNRRLFIENIQTALLGTLPNAINELLASLNAKEITLADLPLELRERWVSKEGIYRIQIFPKHDLNDLANLQTFITEVQTVAPETTDLPVMYWESMKEVIAAFQQAIIIALITIALLLFLIRRNITDTLLVMTPLILAGLFTMASAVITGTPINFANIIALPLLLGLGVDNGIHMVEKLHHSLSEEQNIYQSSTARAMFYGALTTASSFAGLAFSPHQGIASMGLIITIGIFWIMTCTFVILPALSKLILKPSNSMAQRVTE